MNMHFVPTVISQEGRGERSYDLFSRLLKDRIIFVPEINQVTANLIIGQLLFLKADNDKLPIKMYINSPGGSILDGDGILDTMDFVKNAGITIETTVVGKAASFGALILLNGTKGHRNVLPRSRVMIHQPRGGAQGTATDMEIEMKLMLDMKNEINQFVADATGQPLDWVQKHMERDSWFRGQLAVDNKLADNLVN
ncbi:ATP-dependent Clp protease proteolytic subunit [compost metagenome]